MIVAGVGFRTRCTAEELAALVRTAGHPVSLLSAPVRKRAAAALGAATLLGLPVVLIDDDELAAVQHACLTRSAVAARATGHASVAEACALAAAGPGARLVLPRIACPVATCAVAAS